MTAYSGGAVPNTVYSGGTEITSRRDSGTYFFFPTTEILRYKNQGWYNTGNVLEIWITQIPTDPPPSGHALTQIQYVILES